MPPHLPAKPTRTQPLVRTRNFSTPPSALFPGTSGRLLTALVAHHAADVDGPLTLDGLSKDFESVIDMVRERAQTHLRPAPDYLALKGSGVDGTASHPAEVLELIVVAAVPTPADWHHAPADLVARLSVDLGNVVVHYSAHDTGEAETMGEGTAVHVLPS